MRWVLHNVCVCVLVPSYKSSTRPLAAVSKGGGAKPAVRVLCPVLCHNGDERGVEDAKESHERTHETTTPASMRPTDWDAALDSEGEEEEEEIDEDFDLDEPVDEAPIDDADKELAATRLQAVRRGQQGRRLAKAHAEENHPLARMLKAEAEEEQSSAVRLQAARRGQIARQDQRRRTAAASKLQAARRGQEGRREARSQRLELQLAREEAEEDAAAVRMQAARRGQQARRATKQRRGAREPMPLPRQHVPPHRQHVPPHREGRAAAVAPSVPDDRASTGSDELRQLQADLAEARKLLARESARTKEADERAIRAEERAERAERATGGERAHVEAAEREGERLRDRIAELQIHAEDLKQTAEQRVTEAEQRAEEAEQHAVERQHSRPPAAAMSQRMKPALPKSATSGAGPATSSDHALKAEEKARKQAQAAVARAQSLEAVVASLTEKLLEAESSVRMLRTQLRKMQQQHDDPAAKRVAQNMHEGRPAGRPGKAYAPSSAPMFPRLPAKVTGSAPALSKGARDEFQREEERQQRALHKMREEAFTTEAFPDYGGKTRSGLRGIGQKRIEENREQMERRRKQERRRKHLEALQQHGLSPSSRHERLLAQEAAAMRAHHAD